MRRGDVPTVLIKKDVPGMNFDNSMVDNGACFTVFRYICLILISWIEAGVVSFAAHNER